MTAVAVAAVLGACTTQMPPTASPSEFTVIYPLYAGLPSIANVSLADMHDRAEIYCAQYGRLASEGATFDMDGSRYVRYDCVTSTRPVQPEGPKAAPLVPVSGGSGASF